jgi:hypothetical protein
VKSSWLALAALATAGVAGGLAAVLGMAALAGNLLAAPVAVVLGATGYRLWRYADRRVTETVYESVGGNPVGEDAPTDDGDATTRDPTGSEDWHRRGHVSRGPSEGATADPEDPDSWPWSDPFWYDPEAGPDGRDGPSDSGSGSGSGSGAEAGAGPEATDGGTRTDAGTDPHGRTRESEAGDEWTPDGTTGRTRDEGHERGRDGDGPRDRSGDGDGRRTRNHPPSDDEWDPWWRRMHDDRTADGERSDAGAGGHAGSAGSPAEGRSQSLSRAEAAEILGVAPDADAQTIRTAYRERVKEVHPDTPGGSAESFKRVRRAYDRLVDPE